jgi:hypothetical protein
MTTTWAWIKQHPEFLILLAVVILGQVLEKVLQGSVEQPYGSAQFPVIPAVVLAAMAVLGIAVLWLRVRLGGQLVAAGGRLSLFAPDSLPPRYAVADPPRQAIGSGLAVLDVVLVLLVAATLRNPAVALAGHYVSPTWAEVGLVVLVLVATLLVLMKLFRTAGPVVVLLLWSGLDRVVPTAGFVSHAPMPVPTRPRTLTVTPLPTPAPQTSEAELQPTVVAPQRAEAELEPTVVASRAEAELQPTVVAPRDAEAELEPTVVAEATVVSVRNTGSDDEHS